MEYFSGLRNQTGQTLVEYVLVVVFIALMIILAFKEARIGDAVSVSAGRVQNSVVEE